MKWFSVIKNNIKKICIVSIIMLFVLNINIINAENIKDGTKVPILLYHNIVWSEYDGMDPVANMTAEEFRQQMTEILKRGYNPIKLSQYYDYVLLGTPIPENPIVITFDDGYLSNYEIAFPILKELNIPATIFVVTDTVGAQEGAGKVNFSHFTWAQAREMQASGIIDIESHSHTHKDMSKLSISELQLEIRKSKYLIEKNLNKKCNVFAYPYGGYGEDTARMVRWAGYKMQILVDDTASGQVYKVNKPSEGIENIARITVRGFMSCDELFEIINSAMSQ